MTSQLLSQNSFQGNYIQVAGHQYNQHITASADQENTYILRKLKPVLFDATDRTGCLDGTRIELIQTITDWALDPAGPQNILWLYGLAGSGKSALATTIANHLRDKGHLGAFIFCDRDDSERSNPSNIIRTLAYQLSSFDAAVQDAILTVLQKLPDIHLSPILSQFIHLLVNALTSDGVVDTTTPIVVVLDAIDECGNPDSRETVLEILAEMWSQLPLSIRLLVTSRYENDIRGAFEGHEQILSKELVTDSKSNNNDISAYLHSRLARVRKKSRDLQKQRGWPSEDDILSLTQRASGLFVWASTASKYIDGFNPRARLDMLLKGESDSAPERALDKLYQTALESIGHWDDEDFLANFKTAVGIVLVARRPLSHSAIDSLSRPQNGVSCEDTISYLGCLLQQFPTVRLLHPSFADFLFDRSRCSREMWWFRQEKHNHSLAAKCLEHLNRVLKRNLCDIKLSPDPVDEDVPESVSYACLFWTDHVCSISDNEYTDLQFILELLRIFLYQNLLNWIEAMSLLRRSRDVAGRLRALESWMVNLEPEVSSWNVTDMLEMINDGMRFVQLFAVAIEVNPLLVYEVALPFAPKQTLLYKTFHNSQTHISVVGQSYQSWPPLLQMFNTKGQQFRVVSCAYSPDGTRIVSASNESIRVWDASSGVEVLPALSGHSHDVLACRFSPDGGLIASGSFDRTVRLWDAISGSQLLPVLKGHTQSVTCLDFYPNGEYLVSGSRDTTIRIWSRTNGKELVPALQGHDDAIEVVSVSPSGSLIVSGSSNRLGQRIRTWDATSGTPVRQFEMQGLFLGSLNFSRDGVYLIAGGAALHRRIGKFRWKVDEPVDKNMPGGFSRMVSAIVHPNDEVVVTCEYSSPSMIGCWRTHCVGVLEAHTSVSALAVSPAGDTVCSGMDDGTICIWDYHASVNMLHTETDTFRSKVACVVFSPDGKLYISGSWDSTVRISDASSGAQTLPTLRRRSGAAVAALACSPDGMLLASAFSDGVVILWDLISGIQTLSQPVQHMVPSTLIKVIAFSPDNERVVSGYDDGKILIWDAQSGKSVLEPLQLRMPVESVKFSPDGTMIICAGARKDGVIRLWDITSGAETMFIRTPNIHSISASFSLDGLRILAQAVGRDRLDFHKRTRLPTQVWSVHSQTELPSLPSWQDSDPPKVINILEGEWLANHDATQFYGGWPSFLKIICYDIWGRSIAIGTQDRRVLILHVPLNT